MQSLNANTHSVVDTKSGVIPTFETDGLHFIGFDDLHLSVRFDVFQWSPLISPIL